MTEEVVDQSQEEVIVNEPQVTDEVETDGVPVDQTESDETEVIDDSEEIDYEGEKYKVPKALKEAFLRQQDYTRKTQEVAEARKAFEHEQAQEKEYIQRQRQHIQDYAQIHALDMQLQQFKDVNWQQVIDADPVEAMKLDRQYRSLQEMRGGIATRIHQVEAQEAFEKQRSFAKQIEEGQMTLKREIPNWSDTTKQAIADYAISTGFKPEEVAQIIDPRHVKVLHKAYLYDQMMKKAATTPKAEVKPVSKVSSSRDGSTKDPDKMSPDEWLKWRNQQLRKQA